MSAKLKKWVCPQCDGYGFILIEEDGFEVEHACYHCYSEGYLDYDPDIGPSDEAIEQEQHGQA